MRLALAALAVLLLVPVAPARPRDPPPTPGGSNWPPPAWLAAGQRQFWLAFGSFCWRAKCVDFAQPYDRGDVPAVTASTGSPATIHLGFQPSRVTVTLYRDGRWGSPSLLRPPARSVTWRLRSSALVQISAFHAHGVASYLARVTVRP